MKCAVTAILLAGAHGLRSSSRSSSLSSSCGAKGFTGATEVNISIVNGQPASECEWRWQVGLRKSTRQGLPFCGGMLIDPEWVLTAAHCCSKPDFFVVAGDYNAKTVSGSEQVRKAVEVYRHPQYSSSGTKWDFALVKLASPVEFNSCVGSVCLPEADAPVVGGTKCWITGWGTLSAGGSQPPQLQEAEVGIVSNEDCYNKFGYSQSQIEDNMICAQGVKPDGSIADACQGDSGGPLVCEESGSWVIHGATSWGRGCAGAKYPGIWARVTSARGWIDATLAGEAQPTPPAPPGKCPWHGCIWGCGGNDCQYCTSCQK